MRYSRFLKENGYICVMAYIAVFALSLLRMTDRSSYAVSISSLLMLSMGVLLCKKNKKQHK